MSVDGEAVRPDGEADEPGWEVDPDDEWGVAVITMVGRQLKLLREAAGLRAAEFGALVGYGEDLVYKVEAGKRIPRREYLVDADRVLNANGVIEATWEDVKKVRYPKTVRDLGKLEAKAVEIALYECHIVPGLLQTPEHARSVIGAAQPPYSPDDVERMVAARLARQSVFERSPAPALSFVLEEGVLRRPIGGTMAWRQQLERLLEVGQFAQRRASGDADGLRHALRAGWPDRNAEVPGRHGCGPLRRGVQRAADLRTQTPTHP